MPEVIADSDFKRLDIYLTELIDDRSRTFIQKIIADGNVTVNGREANKKTPIFKGDIVSFEMPGVVDLEAKPENLPVDIVYEDDDIVVVNKDKGMVVHPANGNWNGTLVNALLYHCKGRLSDINGVVRPGIVHRIDKNTSGIVVCAKNNKAHLHLSELFKKHDIHRVYYALVHGEIKEKSGDVITKIGRDPSNRLKMAVLDRGKDAITHFTVVQVYDGYTLIRAELETGRTHQIRVHMSYIGHPLVGDTVYGRQKQKICFTGQMLHATSLGFIHPSTNEYIEFNSELPEEFQNILSRLVPHK